MSKVFLAKRMTVHHWLAVCVMGVGLTMLAFAKGDGAGQTGGAGEYRSAVACAVMSAFCKAAQSVVAQRLFKGSGRRVRQTGADRAGPQSAASLEKKVAKKTPETIAAAAFCNGIFSFACLVPPALATGEAAEWSAALASSTVPTWALALSCFSIGATKQLGYFAKFFVVARSSALFLEVLDMLRRVAVIALVVALFHEPFGPAKGLATSLMVASFLWYAYAGLVLKRARVRERGQRPAPASADR
jgi:drug/metabolite transporter (DMT)-like permease